MHQTFYIDIDEEMSSVIDRLNKSMSMDNYFVVPKRALFLQSIVNLKILKREADKMSKRVIIVTQDETVISMAERSGIEIRENLEGVEFVSDASMDELDEFEDDSENESAEEMEEEFEKKVHVNDDKQQRLKNIGSGEYFQSNYGAVDVDHRSSNVRESERTITNKAIKRQIKTSKTRPEKIILQKVAKVSSVKEHVNVNGIRHAKPALKNTNKSLFKSELDPHKAQSLEKLFSSSENHESKSEKNINRNIGNGKIKKVFALFMLLCVFVFAGVAAYLFIPSAKITINTDVNKEKIDTEITALAGVDSGGKNIGLKEINKEDQISISYEVKGVSEVAGKKAKGKVVIYNAYSSESQTLIATTRLESENGKIFRLVKSVVVPGMSTVGGESKPGAIQAEIVADQAGSDFNIESSKFTIPGFAGGPKFDKFYAMSDSAIVGGSSEGESQAVARMVTQADLDNAKQKAEAAFKEKMVQELKDNLLENEISLEQAQKISIAKSSATSRVGSVTDSIEWTVLGSAKALVFNEDDVKKIVLSLVNNKEEAKKVKNEISKIDYGSVESDFEKPSLKIRMYSEVTSTPLIDSEKIKNELLGKNDTQLAEILKKYPSIKSANVEFAPSFITRIPNYPSRVYIEIINEAK